MKPVTILIGLLAGLVALVFDPSEQQQNMIEKNGMKVRWSFLNDRIYFDVSAPTSGWVAIGFNEKPGLEGTYLLMGHVTNGVAEVKEHFVVAPGDYRPMEAFGAPSVVTIGWGVEETGSTSLQFSIPIKANDAFRKQMSPASSLHLLLAYSASDDFQHHSIMRTQTKIQL